MSSLYNILGMAHSDIKDFSKILEYENQATKTAEDYMDFLITTEDNYMELEKEYGGDYYRLSLEGIRKMENMVAESTKSFISNEKKIKKAIDELSKNICSEITSLDNYEKIKKRIIEYIPIRSGFLADVLLDSILIQEIGGYKVRATIVIPVEYEYLPTKQVKHKNEIGNGKEYNAHNDTVRIRVTKLYTDGIHAKYILNDPNADPTFATIIPTDILDYLVNNLSNHIQQTTIKIKLRIIKTIQLEKEFKDLKTITEGIF